MEQKQFDKIIELKRKGDFRKAELEYKSAIINGDYDPRIFTALGKIFFLQDDYQHAINSYMVFFTIMRNQGYYLSDFVNEAFHVFMALIRDTRLVGIMEQNYADGGEIIWRLRNADSVCAYKNALLGQPLNFLVKNIDYGNAGQSIMMFGTTDVDDKNYIKARNLFENYNSAEIKFVLNSIDISTNQYKGIPIKVIVDQIIMV